MQLETFYQLQKTLSRKILIRWAYHAIIFLLNQLEWWFHLIEGTQHSLKQATGHEMKSMI